MKSPEYGPLFGPYSASIQSRVRVIQGCGMMYKALFNDQYTSGYAQKNKDLPVYFVYTVRSMKCTDVV